MENRFILIILFSTTIATVMSSVFVEDSDENEDPQNDQYVFMPRGYFQQEEKRFLRPAEYYSNKWASSKTGKRAEAFDYRQNWDDFLTRRAVRARGNYMKGAPVVLSSQSGGSSHGNGNGVGKSFRRFSKRQLSGDYANRRYFGMRG